MKRRNFLVTGGLATAAVPVMAATWHPFPEKVNFTRDGLDLSISEYADLLTRIESSEHIEPDLYSRGGVVEELEKRMAGILGKESAVFMPTGTLANHLAIRKLAGEKRRVIVQAESHIYRDSGDCASSLSGLNLIALGHDQLDFSLGQVKEAISRTGEGRVKTGVGVISIESPVRRQHNRMFDFDQMQEISGFARENKIKMHLDGARLFNACVHSQKTPSDFAYLFDTVYVSLYKNFNAASGAILAGTRAFTKELYHQRRMFGGGMPQVWPFAAVALHYLDGFLDNYRKSMAHADLFFEQIVKTEKIEIRKLAEGTNVVEMKLKDHSPGQLQKSLALHQIHIPDGDEKTGKVYLKINPSILRRSPEELAEVFNSLTR
jgi:threonine aldolase